MKEVAEEEAEAPAVGTIDPSQMNSEEMKQYSESVAQAADVVDNENSAPAATMAKKAPLDMSAKAALVEQAEAANSAAIEDSKAATKKAAVAAPAAAT